MLFMLRDKTAIYYESVGQGKPMVFIHGLGSSSKDWQDQVDFFSKTHQVIVCDLRGHGRSDKPDKHHTVSGFAKDMADLLEVLIPNQAAVVIGHSLGGMIAFELALDYPKQVERLVILNSFPEVQFFSWKARLAFWARPWVIRLFGMSALSRYLADHLFPKRSQDHLRQQFIKRWSENNPKSYIRTLRAFPGWSVLSKVHLITCPTLLIAADHDYTPLAMQEQLVSRIPEATLVVMTDSGHMTLLDQPEALNRVLADFI